MDAKDSRPPVWVGHVTLATPDIPSTYVFMQELGMREIAKGEEFGVLELRGGTHLVLVPGGAPAGETAYFDLMVEDIDATHVHFTEKGLGPSSIERGKIHSSFTVVSPSGHTIKFNSTHVSAEPV